MDVLVIAAHPDDEVLGCGGTIARLAESGREVGILILGEGITSRYAERADASAAALEALNANSAAAAAILGARWLGNCGFPDNRFDSVPLLDVVHRIEEEVRRAQPHIVFTQHGGDLNIDHVVTFRATLTATRPMAGMSVRHLYAYRVASSTEWAFGQFAPEFRPTVFYDVASTLDRKIAAMEIYESERRPFPHPRSPQALRAAAVALGSEVGLPAAEGFALIRSIE